MRRSAARKAIVSAVVGVVLAGVAGSVACGTSPVGVEACRRIEHARCESAQACGNDLGTPVHLGDPNDKVENVASCIRYYDVECLHGLANAREPSSVDLDACVNAIITGTCDVVKTPESSPACKFLIPPASVVDAGDAEASTEGG